MPRAATTNSSKGGAVKIVVGSLIKRGLLEELDAKARAGETVWRETGSGHGVALMIRKTHYSDQHPGYR